MKGVRHRETTWGKGYTAHPANQQHVLLLPENDSRPFLIPLSFPASSLTGPSEKKLDLLRKEKKENSSSLRGGVMLHSDLVTARNRCQLPTV